MKRIFIKPKEGVKCPLEDGTMLPPEGKEVVSTSYIRRRIKDGSVFIAKKQTTKNQKKNEVKQ